MIRRTVLALLCLAMVAVGLAAAGDTPPAAAATTPIRAAFYYPWFPETWGEGSHFTPELGQYDSGDRATVAEHIAEMQYAKIDAGISSWWGRSSQTNTRLPLLLSEGEKASFEWTLYYELEGTQNPRVRKLTRDVRYIDNHYTDSPAYLHVDGKPVLFVYGGADDDCTTARRWAKANVRDFYLVLKVFPGYTTCADQPSSWHQYGPASAADAQLPFSYTISPGFFWSRESAPRLERDPARFAQNVRDMVASGAEWQLVTTFNEWGEGTIVEPAEEFGSEYLDILARDGQDPPSPSPTSTPSPEPGALSVAAAGDICGGCGPTSDQIVAANPDLVLTLGDNAYNAGSPSEFANLYDPYWGRFKDKTEPSVGNHEYGTSNAGGYRSYFGLPSTGVLYNSFDRGGWHFVRMDTYKMDAAQESWIASDLAADAARCEVAFGHHPRWSSGDHGDDSSQDGAWRALAAAGVDIVLYGHDHDYERIERDGIREFVVGTGGASHYHFHTITQGSQVRIADQFGVLFLELGDGSYTWQFRNIDDTVLDSGTGTCR